MQDLGRFLRDYKELIGLPKDLPKIRALKLQPHTVEGRVGMHKASIRWNSNTDYLTFSCTCKSARNSICKHILALAAALNPSALLTKRLLLGTITEGGKNMAAKTSVEIQVEKKERL